MCIIHFGDDNDSGGILKSPRNFDSWKHLLRVAQIREHNPLIEQSKTVTGNNVPILCYHDRCRKLFMMNVKLKRSRKRMKPLKNLRVKSVVPLVNTAPRPLPIFYPRNVYFVPKTNHQNTSKVPTQEKL